MNFLVVDLEETDLNVYLLKKVENIFYVMLNLNVYTELSISADHEPNGWLLLELRSTIFLATFGSGKYFGR